ncbi:M12 family metallopeptidase [Oligoflexus tunisiensis]|uniref:M12 family metallopeptidase n=1 Tax=Oligoflexus tunisiensis TaxID=708132 RepID=UPI00114CA314|nr:M12 family metallopeptidase [Oligoflexus tunisiensis]
MKFSAKSTALLLLLMGCGGVETDSTTDAVIDADATRWTNPRLIPICFVNRSAVSDEIYRDLLRTAVNEYARAGVYFQKWRDCRSEDYSKPIIRVKFKLGHNWDGNGSYSYGGGMSKVGMTRYGIQGENGATLWIRMDDHYPYSNRSKRKTVMAGTRAAFLHEIGHALGLLHEHTRTDYRPAHGECQAGANHANVYENSSVDYVGRPDYDSVMSYCNLKAERLSAGDIAGIRALYPVLKRY